MRKINKALFSALSVLLLAAFILPCAASADSSLSLPVEVKIGGSVPQTEEVFEVQLKAISPDAPMPDGAENGVFTMKLRGAGTQSFPPVNFTYPRTEKYEVSQIPGKAEFYSYDSTVYELEVLARNTDSGLSLTVLVSRDGQDEKVGNVLFNNSFDPPSKPEHPKTGDNSMISAYAALCTVSLSALGTLLLLIKKRT